MGGRLLRSARNDMPTRGFEIVSKRCQPMHAVEGWSVSGDPTPELSDDPRRSNRSSLNPATHLSPPEKDRPRPVSQGGRTFSLRTAAMI